MNKCTIIGKFAFKEHIMDGQTVKCSTIYNELTKKYGKSNVEYIDTYNWKKNKLRTLSKCFNALKNSKNIIMLPAQNGVKVFGPLLYFCNKIYKRKLHYIVIGSWLFDKIKKNKILKNSLLNFYAIYVETSSLKIKLEELNFNNIYKMDNYKNLNILSANEIPKFKNKEILKTCTFSRINYEKGIDDAISVLKNINEEKIKIRLDIYGPVEEQFKNRLEELLLENKEYISYNGVIDSKNSVEIIKKYDLLLFPTRYFTEGIPGTIIDAFAAGVPVLASKWENYSDIIDNNKNGIIYEFNNLEDFKIKLEKIYNIQENIYSMKENCLKKAKQFCDVSALNILFEKIERD